MLIHNHKAHYRFIKGIDPYSCGVVADSGWEIVRVTLVAAVPWRAGFDLVDEYLGAAGLARTALCAMELRSPGPFSMDGFVAFNREYRGVLEQWELLVDGVNPIARTNVAPLINAPTQVLLHAFCFVRSSSAAPHPSFVVAGAGELRDGVLEAHRIVRRGEVSPDAMLEKADYVLSVMDERLSGLGVGWSLVTSVNLYTIHALDDALRRRLLDRIGPAARHGLCWHITRPPVLEIEFEMDVRGLAMTMQL